MSKKWKDSEIKYMKRFAASKRLEELAQRFDTDPGQVRTKLVELGLATKESSATHTAASDPLVASFEEAVKALHEGKWARAAELFDQVIAESDLLELAGTARQYRTICQAHLAPEGEGEAGDSFVRAVYHKNRGEYRAALELCDGDKGRKDERFLYLAASIHALEGRVDEAAKVLARAIELNPKNRVHAFHDPDFARLRRDPERAGLFGLS